MKYPLVLSALAPALLITAFAQIVVTAPSSSADSGSGSNNTVEFVCENAGAGLSAVDVLRATGEHDIFLDYFSEYDPEGYAILSDPELSDKTIWAPTDAAFEKLGDAPESSSPDEIKAVLGYHITPPRRTVEGDYPIITFEYLADGGEIIHQTRTGILTESDQRVRTKFEDGVYTVEGIRLGPTAWCTQAGSIFSIDEVITEVATPNWFEQTLGQVIYFIFFQNPLLSAIVALCLAGLVGFLVFRIARKRSNPE